MAPFDSTLTTKLSPLIEGQVPDYIQSDHPKFVEFLKQYYQFLEAAEIQVDGVINNIILENTTSWYVLHEDGTKVVAETGVGTTGKFEEGETITGSTSNATATVLLDDLDNSTPKLIVSSNQKFELGETITGTTTGATAKINTYRPNPVQNIQQIIDNVNVDNTTSYLLDEMYRQFMDAIPETLASGTNKRNLLKNVRDLYSSKGTSEGHKLFLRLMFAEEADVFYPTKYMLRTSDGIWTKKSIIRCSNIAGSDGDDVIGQTLVGQTSGATCFVVNAVTFAQGAVSVTEFTIDIDSITGTFVDGETLQADGLTSFTEQKFTIQKIITDGVVDNPGILYSTGDVISLERGGNNAARAQVNTVTVGDISQIIIDEPGQDYRVGDELEFATDSAAVSAKAHVSIIGGSMILEDSDNSDGYEDYLEWETRTNWSYPELEIKLEDDSGRFVLDGTDGSSTDENWFFIMETGTGRLLVPDQSDSQRMVIEAGTESTYGQIGGIIITGTGSGYNSLPTVTVTSTNGTGAKVIPTTKNIGQIRDIQILDAGFNYKAAPVATVDAHFVLKDVTGSFSGGEALTSHEGKITGYAADTQVMTAAIEDVIRVKMEQETGDVTEFVQLEVPTDDVFNRMLGDNVLEGNLVQELLDRELDDTDSTAIALRTELRTGLEDRLVADATNTTKVQIRLERDSDFATTGLFRGKGGVGEDGTISNATIELEYRVAGPDGDRDVAFFRDTRNTRNTTWGEINPANNRQKSMALSLDGTDVGDPIVLSTTADAGDNVLLDGTDGSSSNAGSNVIQESDNAGDNIQFEFHPAVDNNIQRRDIFQLDGTDTEVFTAGGWMLESRAQSEGIGTTSSHEVWTPAGTDDDIVTEDGDNIVLDGTGAKILYRIINESLTVDTVYHKRLDEGSNLLAEGTAERFVNTGAPLSRSMDEGYSFELEDATDSANGRGILILEGKDGNGGAADAEGYYWEFDEYTASHAGDTADCMIMETGEVLLSEESVDDPSGGYDAQTLPMRQKGAGDPIILDHHLIEGVYETITMVMNASDDAGTNEGGYLLYNGFTADERPGSRLAQESGLVAGLFDDIRGDDVLHETQAFVGGNISLNGIDDDQTLADENIINEQLENFVGQTISTANGSAKIIAADIGKVTVGNQFITTDVGQYTATDSQISEDVIRIQDSYYYQDFSYEVRLGQSVNNYMNELKRAVHPSGFAAFGKVTVASLMSVVLQTAGASRIDAPAESFSPILASVLEELFSVKLTTRTGIPKSFEPGNIFQEIRLENGTTNFDIVLDGTDFGTALEAEEGGAISLESSHDDGDQIIIVGSDAGSQVNAGGGISLDGTDSSGANNIDVEGERCTIIMNGNDIIDDVVQNPGAALLLDGTALGEYVLVDADGDDIVLNGNTSDPDSPNDKIVHEDGDCADGNLLTERIVTDSGQLFEGSERLCSETSHGDNIIFESSIGNGRLMSELAAGVPDEDRENLFIRIIKMKVAIPKPLPLNSVGLSSMGVSDMFGEGMGISNIQLEDALRKRGPTINASRLVLDSIDVGGKDDPADFLFGDEPIELEESLYIQQGTGLKFTDFYKWEKKNIVITEDGDYLVGEWNWGGRLLHESTYLPLPMSTFLRPDLLVMENDIYKHSEWGRVELNGTATDNSLGTLDNFGFILLDGLNAMGHGAGDYILRETLTAHNATPNNGQDIPILLEQSEPDGNLWLENNQQNYMLINSTDSLDADNGTVMGLEDDSGSLLTEVTSPKGQSMLLEEGSAVSWNDTLIIESQHLEIETGQNDGEIPALHYGENAYYPEFTRAAEIRQRPTGRIAIQDERAITEIVLNGTDGSSTDAGDNIVFNRTTSTGDDADDKLMTELNAQVILEQCDSGLIKLDGTDGASANADDYIFYEAGTFASLIATGVAFLPLGQEAETFDNESRTTFDSTQQTYDVVEGA